MIGDLSNFLIEKYLYCYLLQHMFSKLHIKDKSETGKFCKVAPFRKEIRKTEPHKHNNYFEIIYLSKGSGFHYIDNNEFQIQSPTIFFIKKEQVHYWNILSLSMLAVDLQLFFGGLTLYTVFAMPWD